ELAVIGQAFDAGAPLLVSDAGRRTPALAARLGMQAALLVPLARDGERAGLLVVGFGKSAAAGSVVADAAETADAFLTALELFRLRESQQLERDVRQLMKEFAESLAATLNLGAGLDIFCHGTNRLFGADRTSVWIHDRRARSLVLQASSDTGDVVRGVRISIDDTSAPAAIAMRRTRAETVPASDEDVTALVTVPLRG